MTDLPILPLNHLWDELLKVSIFLQRPAVQHQFLAVVVTALLAWAVSRWVWSWLKRRYPQLKVDEDCNQQLAR